MLKKYVTSIYISRIVVGKLSYNWKVLRQIVLLIIDKNSEINLYYTILLLDLIISLRVKSSKKPLLNFHEVIER